MVNFRRKHDSEKAARILSDWEFFIQFLRVGVKAAAIILTLGSVFFLFWCALKGK